MENKTSKYVKYAIGEILLVVIGILIALQINNWNESKKARNYEVKILQEIRKDLILDTIYFNAIKSRPKRAEWAVDRLREMKMNNAINEDSIPSLVYTMSIGYRFVYHNGAYESLKSVGLDKISNDSLRNMLSDMYGFYFPRTKDMIVPKEAEMDKFMDETIEMLFEYDVYNRYPNGPPHPHPKISVDSLFDNERFKLSFFKVKSTTIDAVRRLESLTKNVTDLLQLIDKELQIEDPLKDIPTKDWSQ